MKFCTYVLISIFLSIGIISAEEIKSPDNSIVMAINIGPTLSYSVSKDGVALIKKGTIDLHVLNEDALSSELSSFEVKKRTVNSEIIPVVRTKNSEIKDEFNELTIVFNHYDVIIRIYNDGVAYRIRTKFDNQIIISDELVQVDFNDDFPAYFPEEESFISHQERMFKNVRLNEVSAERFCSQPVLVDCNDACKVLLCESDLRDYPGLYYRGNGDNSLIGKFPGYVLKESMKNDRNPVIEERANYIAKTSGNRELPWRVFIIEKQDKDLLESELVYKLADPSVLKDVSWIRPGKVAWDWWNFNNLSGVDFRAGVNTDTYKYFIDFASANGIEYVVLDEGWYELGNLLKQAPGIDVPEIIRYGEKKNVGIILWAIWKTLDDQLDEAMNLFEKWGVKGLKVDFMQRDDQWMVNYYEKITRECAKRKMLVDFHGAYTPRGLRRTYPNLITREGVQGLEHYKWESQQGPDHELTIPFTRMVTGPMDFTPGAMTNATENAFYHFFTKPMSKGTRCHQLAMYVVYESPLQMLADAPTNYEKNPECLEFLSYVPTEWDKTVALDGKIGDYILVARQKDDVWYIGAMTDWTAREFNIKLDFMDKGEYNMIIYKDGINADRNAEDFKMESSIVNDNSTLKIKMAPGGGFVGVIKRK